MAVPPQNELHRPLLEIALGAGEPLHKTQYLETVAYRLSLTAEDLAEMLPSGQQSRILNRVDWGLYYLLKAGLLQRPSRGSYQITTSGRDYLKDHTGPISFSQLRTLTDRRESEDERSPTRISPQSPFHCGKPNESDSSPQERIDSGYREQQDQLADELLNSISQISPEGFERLVVDLLENMGYGRGEAIGKSGDAGIDGIINQDALGLEKVYMQAKRWQSQVGEPEIRNFSGSLDAKGASKGVFVTTSSFSASATQTAKTISAGSKFIRLIDGPELARLMLEHDVGVITRYTYKIQTLDENYFSEDL